jgi:2-dehydro-3-deoxygluconokinase
MMAARVVTFGEIMLRLSPPGFERFFQSPVLGATFGGGEANVAISLAQFGLDSRYVTRVPNHAVGDGALRALRADGVNVDGVLRGGERLGIYFAESGASQRASNVIYDRAHASIADAKPGMFAWDTLLAGADWFHVTGITPALGPDVAACTREAVESARRAGAKVSIDLNYRKKLWSVTDARQTMRALTGLAHVIIANEEDIQACLGIDVVGADVVGGTLDVSGYRATAERVAKEFGVAYVAITLRESHSASRNGWSAVLWDAAAGEFHHSSHYDITVIDRIGGGDSFASGLIYGLVTGRAPASALQFAVAASALKHTIPGDFNRVSVSEVDRLVSGDASGRVQR